MEEKFSPEQSLLLISKTIEETRGLKNTLIIFTCDNGGHIRFTRQLPLRSGKGSYYEGGIRVPMAVSWPRKIPATRRIDDPVTQLDILPTLVDVVRDGRESSNSVEPEFDGISLLPLLTRDEPIPPRPLFWHFPIYLEAYDRKNDEPRDSLFRTRPGSVIRLGEWKLHQYFEDMGLELYNLVRDSSEQFNLAKTHPAKTNELLELLEGWRTETGAPVPSQLNPDYDPETAPQIKLYTP
jgi:arylsulfatase A-like enzyme